MPVFMELDTDINGGEIALVAVDEIVSVESAGDEYASIYLKSGHEVQVAETVREIRDRLQKLGETYIVS